MTTNEVSQHAPKPPNFIFLLGMVRRCWVFLNFVGSQCVSNKLPLGSHHVPQVLSVSQHVPNSMLLYPITFALITLIPSEHGVPKISDYYAPHLLKEVPGWVALILRNIVLQGH